MKGEPARQAQEVFTEGTRPSCSTELDDKGLLRFAHTCARAYNLATPVLTAPRRSHQGSLTLANKPTSGQETLFAEERRGLRPRRTSGRHVHAEAPNHLVDDKIHARSIGRTRRHAAAAGWQGAVRWTAWGRWRSGHGGLRSAYALQEFLTVKSRRRHRAHAHVRGDRQGEHVLESGLPESFNVLLKELQSLCLNVELIEDPNAPRKQGRPSSSWRARCGQM